MLSVRFPEQETGGPDEEAFEVTFDDGRVERLTMHDYGRVYAIPVSTRRSSSGCWAARRPTWWRAWWRTPRPARSASSISAPATASRARRSRSAGVRPVVAIDTEPEARTATLRDRPGLYELVLTGDVSALAPADVDAIRALRPNALTLVGALGNDHVAPEGLAAAAALLTDDALIAYAHPDYEDDAPLRAALEELGEGHRARPRALRPPPHGLRRGADLGGGGGAAAPPHHLSLRSRVSLPTRRRRPGRATR